MSTTDAEGEIRRARMDLERLNSSRGDAPADAGHTAADPVEVRLSDQDQRWLAAVMAAGILRRRGEIDDAEHLAVVNRAELTDTLRFKLEQQMQKTVEGLKALDDLEKEVEQSNRSTEGGSK